MHTTRFATASHSLTQTTGSVIGLSTVAIVGNLFSLSVVLNALPMTLEFEHMHAYKIGPMPLGYMPFFLTLALMSLVSFGSRPSSSVARVTTPILKRPLNKSSSIPWTIFGPLVGLVLYILASCFWVVSHRSWLIYSVMWFYYIVSFLLITTWFARHLDWVQCKSIFTWMGYATVFVAAVGIIRYLVLGNPDANPWPLINRNGFVFYLIPSIPVLYAACETTGKSRFVALSLLCIAMIGCALTFSRMGMMGMSLAMGLYFLYPTTRTFARGLLAVLFSAVCLWLISRYVPHVSAKIESITNTVTALVTDAEIMEGQLDYRRFVLLEEAKAIVREHWLLGTGVGLENYLENYSANEMEPMKPHNLYLSYLAEFGVVGFSCLLAFMLGITYCLFRAVRHARNTNAFPLMKGLLCGHVAVMFMFVFNEYITSPTVWAFWGFAIGAALIVLQQPILVFHPRNSRDDYSTDGGRRYRRYPVPQSY